MAVSSSRWDVRPGNPRATRAFLGSFVVAQFVVVAAVHTVAVVIGLSVAILIEAAFMTLLLWSLRRADAKRLAAAPPGTLFVGQGEVRLATLRDQPRLASMAQGRRGFALVGTITVDHVGIRFTPRFPKAGSLTTADINWADLHTLRAIAMQGKINVGQVDLQTQKGTHLRLQVAGYSRLVAALSRAPARSAAAR